MNRRLLLYSHDSYGLGHLRRNMRLAQAALDGGRVQSVLVLTGSGAAPRFDWPANADFVRLPGVTKSPLGEYISACDGLGVQEVLSLRSEILLAAVKEFQPDVFVVDKSPLGLLGEAEEALSWLHHNRRCHIVLGLRDVLDEPVVVARELGDMKVWSALTDVYSEIWVYGCKGVYDAVSKYPGLAEVSHKVVFTGYWADHGKSQPLKQAGQEREGILVTAGGGADGFRLLDTFLEMYERSGDSLFPATMVGGPFLDGARAEELAGRCADSRVRFHRFHASMGQLLEKSRCIVCMGGYNTICEVASRRKPCVVVPREHPRREQTIRTEIFERLGLANMLSLDDLSPDSLAAKVREADEKERAELPACISFDAHKTVQDRLDVLFMELS